MWVRMGTWVRVCRCKWVCECVGEGESGCVGVWVYG